MDTDRKAFWAAIAARPGDDLPRLVYADWLEEHGDAQTAQQMRTPQPWCGNQQPFQNYGSGYGSGYGDGYSHGDGSGYGYGSGDGSGDGYGYIQKEWNAMCEVGKRLMIVLPHAWVICGDVTEQIGPFSFVVERASVICRTQGTPWDRLAGGEGRERATFRPWGRVTISNPFLCMEWKGELPSMEPAATNRRTRRAAT